MAKCFCLFVPNIFDNNKLLLSPVKEEFPSSVTVAYSIISSSGAGVPVFWHGGGKPPKSHCHLICLSTCLQENQWPSQHWFIHYFKCPNST